MANDRRRTKWSGQRCGRDASWQGRFKDDDVDRLNIILVAPRIDSQDRMAAYRDAWQALQNPFADHLEDLRRINFVVRSEEEVRQFGIYSIGREYEDYYAFRSVITTR
jgi:hypothetical protein